MVDVCPNCKQPTSMRDSGSLTQWMFICHCNSIENEVPTDDLDSYRFQMCRKCRKRINAGREGSLTQFIFRSDTCRCEEPEVLDVAVARPTATKMVQSPAFGLSEDEEEELEALNLSSENFPVDRFVPFEELGRGASGAVYLCRDRLLRTNVAVKILHHLSSEQLLSFQQEAKAISRLSHPNIVRILDFGATESGTPYMVLEYVHGSDLLKYIQRVGQLELRPIVELMISVCDALDYSHQKDIFHRDLKPSNILVVEGARLSAKLVDFGVARVKFETQEPTICSGTAIIGTPAYMSPDQMRGISYDQRSEIYSLGCILFELITGRQIYSGETVLEIASCHANSPIPLLEDEFESFELAPQFDRVLAGCLAKSPDDRFQSAAELGASLEAILEHPSLQQETDDEASVDADQGPERMGLLANSPGLVSQEANNQGLARARRKYLTLIVLAISIVSVGASVFLYLRSNRASSGEASKVKEKLRPDIFLSEMTFNVNQFNGNYWLFNMAPVNDASVDSILKARHNRRLWLDSGSLSPQAILRLKPLNVVAVALMGMPMSPAHVESLVQLETIKQLRLFDNSELSDESLDLISRMPRLSELFLRSELISDKAITSLQSMPRLKMLSLDRCSRLTDACLEPISKMSKLERLSLAGTGLGAPGVLEAIAFPNLTTLSLAKLPCDSRCYDALARSNLERLSLREVAIERKELMKLAGMRQLRLLDLRETPIKRNHVKEFLEARAVKGLPEVLVLGHQNRGLGTLGEMVFETLDYEHLWTDSLHD